MPSERVQRRIDDLLDQTEEAVKATEWLRVQELTTAVLDADPENEDALTFRGMAESILNELTPAVAATTSTTAEPLTTEPASTPDAFAGGRYQVSKFLGEGGKKRVYLAHDTLLDREVAFALIKTEGFDQTSKERISREAQAMGRLGVHPNIVAVLDLGQEDDGSPFMVTELMGGGDTEGVLEEAEENRLSLERTIEIGKAVCEGLEFAHARGIVHRDLKPGNVWLTEDGIAKIGDFGLAMLTDRSRLTREAMMIGTVSYMPPEQATGGDITPKADLYSLGAMLYEMVTGRPPFLGDDDIAIIGQHINTPPVAPTWHNGDCPRPLEALIMRMLAKDPSARPESAQDVLNVLDTIDLTTRGETVEREANSLESLAGGVFVGRQAEMDQLKAALEDVLGGRGRLVTLVGEPGIGKTRTSEELATYAGLRGAQVLWGRCYEGGGAPPYWPWVQAIRSYVRDIEPDELRRLMGSSASVIAEIVTDIKDWLPEVQPPPPVDDPNSARFRLFDSITSFLKAASQSQPVVIVLDDLHWSDQPTLTFLEFIARELNQSRVLLLCTYRDMELNRRHPLSITLGDLARDRLYERVTLRGLNESDIARFVEIAAGITAPSELSATVQRHTEGNPLFVTEVIRDLVQSGELTEERISGRSTWSVRIPEGVREVIGRRLDRLSDRANETFTTAAVIGRDFTLTALRELAEDTTEGQLLDVLDEALDAKLIEELPDEIGHYQFTHALIQETLTGELSSARKVRLHARIAESLESLYGDVADQHAVELVPHFDEAEPVLGPDKLIRYATRAGHDALRSHANEQAESMFSRALNAMGDIPVDAVSADILTGLGRARMATSYGIGIADALDPLERAFDFYSETGDGEQASYVALQQIFTRPGVMARTAPMLERALEMVPDDSLRAGYLASTLVRVLAYDLVDLERSQIFAEQALQIARAHEDRTLEMQTLLRSTQAYVSASKHRQALKLLSDAESLVDQVTQQEVIAEFHNLAVAFRWHTDTAVAAERHLEMVKTLTEKTGSRNAISNVVYAQSLVAWNKGDLESARSVVDEGVNLYPTSNRIGVTQGAIALDQGDPGPARAYIERVMSSEVESIAYGSPWAKRFAMNFVAFLYYKCGQCGGTKEDFVRSITMAEEVLETEESSGLVLTLAHMARAMSAAAVGDSVRCQESYDYLKRMDVVPSYGWGISEPNVLGVLSAATGDYDLATSQFEAALDNSKNQGYRLHEAQILFDHSEMILDRDEPGDREKAIELQDEALAITQELGMRPLTERILARREILRA